MIRFQHAVLSSAFILVSCAAPPLTLYTLDVPSATAADAAALGPQPNVIEITRATIPDELDTQDLIVRDGSMLQRSTKGRWASRLSVGITDRITERLAVRRPDALVTDRQQSGTASYRIQINISRLDITATGTAALEADWTIVPHDAARPIQRDRVKLTATGSVTTDADTVALTGNLLDQLAAKIDLTNLR